MIPVFRLGLIAVLISISTSQNGVELGQEPFSSHVVRKTLDNGTIVEYEYLYYYDDSLEDQEESFDFDDDEDILVSTLIPSTTPTASTYTTTPSTVATTEDRSFIEKETNTVGFGEIIHNEVTESAQFAPSSFSARGRFRDRPRVSPPIATDAPEPIPTVKYEVDEAQSSSAGVSTGTNRGSSRFFGSRARGQGVRPPNQASNGSRSPLRPRIQSGFRQRGSVDITTETSLPAIFNTSPIQTSQKLDESTNSLTPGRTRPRFTASPTNEQKPSAPTNRRRRPQSGRPVPQPAFIPITQPSSFPSRSSINRSRGRQRANSDRPVLPSNSVTEFGVDSSKAAEISDERKQQPPSVEINAIEGTSSKFPSRSLRNRSRGRLSLNSDRSALSSVGDSGTQKSSTAEISSESEQPSSSIESNAIEEILGLHHSRESKKLSRGGDQWQAVTPSNDLRGHLPRGTRFPPRASSTNIPFTTLLTTTESVPDVEVTNTNTIDANIPQVDGSKLYSLSRVVGQENDSSIISTTIAPETTTVFQDDTTFTTQRSDSTVTPIDNSLPVEANSNSVRFHSLRPRPTAIINLVPLPPVNEKHTVKESTAWSHTNTQQSAHTNTLPIEYERTTLTYTTELSNKESDQTSTDAKYETSTQAPDDTKIGQIRGGGRRPSGVRRGSLGGRRRFNNIKTTQPENPILGTDEESPVGTDEQQLPETREPSRRQPPRRRQFGRRPRPLPGKFSENSPPKEDSTDPQNEDIDIINGGLSKEVEPKTPEETRKPFRKSQSGNNRLRSRGSLSSKIRSNEPLSGSAASTESPDTVVSISKEEISAPTNTNDGHKRFRSHRKHPSPHRFNSQVAKSQKEEQAEENLGEDTAQHSETPDKTVSAVADSIEEENTVTKNERSRTDKRRFRGLGGRRRRPQSRPAKSESLEGSAAQNEGKIQETREKPRETEQQASTRSQSSRRRSFRRNNSRPRGFLPPTIKPSSVETTTAVERIETTETTTITDEETTLVPSTTQSVEDSKEKTLSRLRSHSAIKSHSVARTEEPKEMAEKETGDEDSKQIEESSGQEEEEEDEEEKDKSTVVSGSRELRFTTARKAPSFRDRNSLAVQRSLFSDRRRRPAPFRRNPPQSRLITTETVAQTSSETPTTVPTTTTTATTKAAVENTGNTDVAQKYGKPFEKTFNQDRTGSIAERRRKFVPGGLRRPSSAGLRALSSLSVNQDHTSSSDESVSPLTNQKRESHSLSRTGHHRTVSEEPHSTETSVSGAEDLSGEEDTTTQAPSRSRGRLSGGGRARAGRNTKLTLSEQLHLLNG